MRQREDKAGSTLGCYTFKAALSIGSIVSSGLRCRHASQPPAHILSGTDSDALHSFPTRADMTSRGFQRRHILHRIGTSQGCRLYSLSGGHVRQVPPFRLDSRKIHY
jgi:hypothetical protein